MSPCHRFLECAFLAVLFVGASFNLANGQEPDALPLYKQATTMLGTLDMNAHPRVLSFEDAAKLSELSEETKSLFRRPDIGKIMGLLIQAASIPNCSFPLDPGIGADSFFLPTACGRLAALVRIGAAIKEPKQPENALTLLLTAYQIGHHLSMNGPIIGTLGGVSHRVKALRMLLAFFQRHPEPAFKKRAREYFQALSQPLVNVPDVIRRHRAVMEKTMIEARTTPTALASAGLILDPAPEAIARFRPEIAPAKECRENQEKLLAAGRMLNMDLQDSGAHALTNVIGMLVEKKYLTSAPACPVGGSYSFTFYEKADPTVKCSVHPGLDTPLPLASPQDLEAPYRALVASSAFEGYVQELMTMHDESLALDPKAPDYASRAAVLQQRFEVASNPLILAFAPDAARLYRLGKTLQEAYDRLMKEL